MRSLLSRLRRFRRGEAGNATIEFVIVFPVFMVLTVSGIEMGILTLRQVMLERGVDITVRSLRIGLMEDPTFETVRSAICQNALIIPNCTEVVHLELTPVTTDTWAVPETAVTCVDRNEEVDPVVNFNAGQRNEFMLMRACSVFDPLFPNYGLGPELPLDSSGGYRLIASTSFVNEPWSVMRKPVRRFLREERGTLSVEAILMGPLLIMSLFLMFTIFDIFRFDATNSKAAYTIGDLLSRQLDPVDQDFIDGMKDIFDYIVLKDEGTWLRVSVVRYDGDDDELKLVWSRGNTGVAALTDGTFSTIENAIPAMSEEDTVIVVETYMPYYGYVPFFSGFESFSFKNTVITRPRFASQLCWQSCS